MLVDVQVNHSSQVVNVRDKHILLAHGKKAVKQTGVVHGIEEVTVAWWVPQILVGRRAAGAGKKTVPVNTRVARLVERHNLHVMVRVLLNDTRRIVVRVERVHQDEWYVHIIRAIQVLNLTHGHIEERHTLAYFNHTLWARAAHCRAKTAIKLQHSQLVQDGWVRRLRQRRVRRHLFWCRRLDLVPVTERNMCVSICIVKRTVSRPSLSQRGSD